MAKSNKYAMSMYITLILATILYGENHIGFQLESSFVRSPIGVGFVMFTDNYSFVFNCSGKPLCIKVLDSDNSNIRTEHFIHSFRKEVNTLEKVDSHIDFSFCIGKNISSKIYLFGGPIVSKIQYFQKYDDPDHILSSDGEYAIRLDNDKIYSDEHEIDYGCQAGLYYITNCIIFKNTLFVGSSLGCLKKQKEPFVKLIIGMAY